MEKVRVFESKSENARTIVTEKFTRLGWSADESTFYYISALKKGVVGVDGALYLNPEKISTKRSNAKVHIDKKNFCDDQGQMTDLGKAWALANLHFLAGRPVAESLQKEEGEPVQVQEQEQEQQEQQNQQQQQQQQALQQQQHEPVAEGPPMRANLPLFAAEPEAAARPEPAAADGSAEQPEAAAANGSDRGSFNNDADEPMGEASADPLNFTHVINELKAQLQARAEAYCELVEANKALTAELQAANARVAALSLENADALETVLSYMDSRPSASGTSADVKKRARDEDSAGAVNISAASSNSGFERVHADAVPAPAPAPAASGGFGFGAAAAPALAPLGSFGFGAPPPDQAIRKNRFGVPLLEWPLLE